RTLPSFPTRRSSDLPTGSGKTLTAFLWCLERLMFAPQPEKAARCRVLYVSPLKALAVDVERNLRAPLAGIAQVASALGETYVTRSEEHTSELQSLAY